MIKTIKIVVLGALITTNLAMARATYNYDGEISQIIKGTEGCDEVFTTGKYHLKLFFVGSSNVNIVWHYRNADKEGFFHGMSTFGRIARNEFYSDNQVQNPNGAFNVNFDGMADEGFVLGDLRVAKIDTTTGEPICTTKAVFTAFAR